MLSTSRNASSVVSKVVSISSSGVASGGRPFSSKFMLGRPEACADGLRLTWDEDSIKRDLPVSTVTSLI